MYIWKNGFLWTFYYSEVVEESLIIVITLIETETNFDFSCFNEWRYNYCGQKLIEYIRKFSVKFKISLEFMNHFIYFYFF